MLHDGSIAEMKTGEGKTLVSTLAAYLNALTSEGVHGMCYCQHSRSLNSLGSFFRCQHLAFRKGNFSNF